MEAFHGVSVEIGGVFGVFRRFLEFFMEIEVDLWEMMFGIGAWRSRELQGASRGRSSASPLNALIPLAPERSYMTPEMKPSTINIFETKESPGNLTALSQTPRSRREEEPRSVSGISVAFKGKSRGSQRCFREP